MKVNINSIQVNDGRRRLNRERVAEIAESIQTVGLLNPVTVTRDNVLVAGAHRLEACKLLGWSEIDATIIEATGPAIRDDQGRIIGARGLSCTPVYEVRS